MSTLTTQKKRLLTFLLVLSAFFLGFSPSKSFTDQYCPDCVNSFLPFHQHYISSIQTNGNLLEFDDGSIWMVHKNYKSRLRHWRSGDIIEFSQSSHNMKSTYRFWITNKTLNSYVLAEISQGPIIGHVLSQKISFIDPNLIVLESGSFVNSTWILDSRDLNIYRYWDVGNTVIVGKNYSWFGWLQRSDILLYNVEKNQYIRAYLR